MTTAGGWLAFDYLVVALGAQTRPESVEGFSEMAYDLYDVIGCLKIRDALERFDRGTVDNAPVVGQVPPSGRVR